MITEHHQESYNWHQGYDSPFPKSSLHSWLLGHREWLFSGPLICHFLASWAQTGNSGCWLNSAPTLHCVLSGFLQAGRYGASKGFTALWVVSSHNSFTWKAFAECFYFDYVSCKKASERAEGMCWFLYYMKLACAKEGLNSFGCSSRCMDLDVFSCGGEKAALMFLVWPQSKVLFFFFFFSEHQQLRNNKDVCVLLSAKVRLSMNIPWRYIR